MGDTIVLILWAIFAQKPTPEIIVITIATFATILWLCFGLMKLRKQKPPSIDKETK